MRTNGQLVDWIGFSPRRQRWGTVHSPEDLSRVIGQRHLSEKSVSERYDGSSFGEICAGPCAGVDPGVKYALSLALFGSHGSMRSMLIRNGTLRSRFGLRHLEKVIETAKTPMIRAVEATLRVPDFRDPKAVSAYLTAVFAAGLVLIPFYAGAKIAKARTSVAIATRRESDKIAWSILGKLGCSPSPRAWRPGMKIQCAIFVGSASFRTPHGSAGGGSLVSHIIEALARVTLVLKVGEEYTSQKCCGCCRVLEQAAAAKQKHRVHVCKHCLSFFNRDVSSAVQICRLGRLFLRGGSRPPAFSYPSA